METTVTKKNEELREITSVVLVPEVADWHDEIYSAKEIRKAERNFSKYCKKANLQHEHQLDESMAEFVESYITPSDMIVDNRVVKKGSWMATLKCHSDALWDAVKDGTFKGFSIGCKVRVEQIIAKAKGDFEGDLGRQATKRLSDFNFKDDFAHVALVTEGANGSDILVMKAKEQEQQTPNEPQDSSESVKIEKDNNMSEVNKEEIEALKAREIELQKEIEAMKAKSEEDAKLAEEIEAMKAKEAEMAEELEAFKAKEVEAKKAKEEAEKAEFVAKAKDMSGICSEEEAEEFGADMFALKALAPEAFDRVLKKLEKAEERVAKLDVVEKSAGSSEEGQSELEGEELIEFKAKALMEEDSNLSAAQARIKVRKKMRHDKAREAAE